MKVIITIGVPGSGKSTYVREHFPAGKVYGCYSTDDFFMKDGEYVFDGKQIGAAHAWNTRRAIEAFQDTKDSDSDGYIIIDNTNTTAIEIAAYAQPALAYGHEVELLVVHCDPKVAAARNTHGVPKEAVLRMHKRMMNTLSKSPEGYYRSLVPWWPVTEVGDVPK
jgi:predicted kinase